MMNFAELASIPDSPVLSTDQLQLAVAGYLARFKNSSTEHTESDLRGGCSPAVSQPDGCGMILIEGRVGDRGHDISCCLDRPGPLTGSGP